MTYTLVWGSKLLTCDRLSSAVISIDNGAVVQRDGVIIQVGEKEELKQAHPDAEELGSSNCWILPGFVNAHYHGKGLTNFQLGIIDQGLELWMLEVMNRYTADPYLDTLYASIKQIESGVTTLIHSYYRTGRSTFQPHLSDSIRAYQDSGVNAAISLGIKDSNIFVYQDNGEFLDTLPQNFKDDIGRYLAGQGEILPHEYLETVLDFHEQFNGESGKIKILMGPVGQWCSDELLEQAGETAERLNMGLHFHALESIYQREYYWKRYGKSLLSHLNDMALLGPKASCAHSIWIDEKDVDLLVRTGASLVHNPSSNLRLKNGVMPLGILIEGGVNVGLGTDGMSLNDDEDFLQEMRLCMNLHRLPGLESFSPAGSDVFRMATLNGARAAIMEDYTGSLEEGKAADLILVKTDSMFDPFMEREVDALECLLHRAKGSDVETVMVGGEILMKNRNITFADKKEVEKELIKSLRKIEELSDDENRTISDKLKPYVRRFYQGWEANRIKSKYTYNTIV